MQRYGIRIPALFLLVLLAAAQAPAAGSSSALQRPFQVWLVELIQEAVRLGLDRALVEDTLRGLQPLPQVIKADRAQAEVALSLDRYLAARLTPEVVENGRAMRRAHDAVLGRIELAFGVPAPYVVAIWGAETGYGRYTGDVPVFRALATLAWEPRRAGYFRQELFAALWMVQRGHIDRQVMVGSWAGAMGQPQFMPSSYLQYAVDFDGDGRRDIWSSVPDTLASIAHYLGEFGWRAGTTWGREVRVTATARARIERSAPRRVEGCGAMRLLTERRPLERWASWGIRRADGSALPRAAIEASLLEVDGRAFLVYPNYEAILGYNCAHLYALSVSMLADQIRSDSR